MLDRMEETETEGLVPYPSAGDLLAKLPPAAWAIVTSGSRAVARLRLEVSGLPIPQVVVTGEDVEQGKPDPQGYGLAAARLDFLPAECVVVEDAPPGIAAARAAGMRVIAVETTHPAERLQQADARVVSLSALRVEPRNGALWLALGR
jgi:mannitol-1-/sugar-/sorbitol-6-phosphatase